MRCSKAHDWINRQLDGELNAGRIARLGEHLAMCPECAQRERQARRLHAGLAALRAASGAPVESPIRFRPDRRALRWRAGLAVAAGVAVMLAGSWLVIQHTGWHRAATPIAGRDTAGEHPSGSVPTRPALVSIAPTGDIPQSGDGVRIQFAESSPMIAVPVETGDAGVTIIRLYPTLRVGQPGRDGERHERKQGVVG